MMQEQEHPFWTQNKGTEAIQQGKKEVVTEDIFLSLYGFSDPLGTHRAHTVQGI